MSIASLSRVQPMKRRWLLAVPLCLMGVGIWAVHRWDHPEREPESPRFLAESKGATSASLPKSSQGPVSAVGAPISATLAAETAAEIVTVRVVDRTGGPVPGAHVRYERRSELRGPGIPPAVVESGAWNISDGMGRVHVTIPRSSVGVLVAGGDGFVQTEHPFDALATSVELVLVRAARLTALLIDARTGAPLPKVSATVTIGDVRTEIASDADGRAALPPCAPGDRLVAFDFAGFRSESVRVDGLGEGEDRIVRVVCTEGARVRGVVRAAGAPVSGAVITILDRWTSRRIASCFSDAEGAFDLPVGVEGRDYIVEARHEGFVGETVVVAGGTPRGFEVEEPWHFDLRVGSGSEIPTNARILVTRSDGLPSGPEGAGWSFEVGADGRLRVDGLTDGVAYRFTMSAPGFGVVEWKQVDKESAFEPFACPLIVATSVRGRVFDTEGRPMPGAVVRATRSDGFPAPALFTTADAEGFYSISGVVPGAVHVVPFRPGFDGRRRTVSTAESSVDVMLQRL